MKLCIKWGLLWTWKWELILLEGWLYGSGGCIWCGGKKDEGILPVGWAEVYEKGWIFTMFERGASRGGSDVGSCDDTDEGPPDASSISSSVCIAGRLLAQLNIPSKRESSRKTGLASKWEFIRAKISFFWPSVVSPGYYIVKPKNK